MTTPKQPTTSKDNFLPTPGWAARHTLDHPEMAASLDVLEQKQAEFLSKESLFRSREYPWPRDPLHCWSRVWEYPFAWQHIQHWIDQNHRENLRMVDFGSGLTFFPFALAETGAEILCLDNDPVVIRDLNSAIHVVDPVSGSVRAQLSEDTTLPLPDQSSDILYSISVLEHIPQKMVILQEIERVLKPGGLFLMTLDMDLNDTGFGLGQIELDELNRFLERSFQPLYPHQPNPGQATLLRPNNSPYPRHNLSWLAMPWFVFKQHVLKRLVRGVGATPTSLAEATADLAVYGLVLRKR